ncbi:GLY1 [Scenedesmus sp. PABB004]|nr:GLY1 [Scenedesmus sp. PABB004]
MRAFAPHRARSSAPRCCGGRPGLQQQSRPALRHAGAARPGSLQQQLSSGGRGAALACSRVPAAVHAAPAEQPPSSWAPLLARPAAGAARCSGSGSGVGSRARGRRPRGASSAPLRVVALDKDEGCEQPPESAGILPEDAQRLALGGSQDSSRNGSSSLPFLPGASKAGGGAGAVAAAGSRPASPTAAVAASAASAAAAGAGGAGGEAAAAGARALYPPAERSQIQESWDTLMRWSRTFRQRQANSLSPIEAADKVVVFGGGSFGTAMGTSLALKKASLDVVLLLRDPYLCKDINTRHANTKYLPDFSLPPNVRATTDAAEAIAGASYAVHAVPVQHSRAFLGSIRDVLPKDVPIVCVSKGLEVGSGCMMSEVIPSALGRRQPAVFLSGPSFAKEVMQGRPTGVVAACKELALAREIQELFASPNMRVNTSTDVTGVEICGALKNVLAIAAGIVEGLDLGHNALAALIAQGCAEIRWLSQKVGAKPATISGLSGLGDIMLTCYGDLSRNRSVGVRLGRGEALADILASSSQVAEGVATAGVVVGLARKYRVSLPVLTAVAQVLDNNLAPAEAVAAVMNLPQIEER